MTDRAMQALYLLALDPVAETTADLDSYGFRQGRSCADAIERCFVSLASGNAAEWVLEGDIKGCFDNISHDWMLAHLPVDKAVLRKWLKAGYVEGGKLFPTDAGTPQGGIISPTLANLVLDGMEEMLQKLGKVTFNKKGVCGNPWKLNFCRYADDFIVTSYSREVLETRVKPAIESFLKERGLELSQEKTRITHISEGFDFLGQTVRKFDGTLLTRPSKKSVRQIFAKVREIVTGNKASTQAGLIRLLNPVIRGWAMYHRHAVSSDAFARVKDYVWGLLWRWAKRRHTNKSRNWIMRRYFMTIEGRSWVFACRDGNQKLVRLFEAPDLKIQRHVKVQGKANPYDPEWEPYFEERMKFKMLASTVGRRKLLSIWLAQEGKCPMCNQPVTKESGWHVHHLKWRVHGGGDEKSNLALLHQNCHAQVHSLGLHSLPVPLTRRLRKA